MHRLSSTIGFSRSCPAAWRCRLFAASVSALSACLFLSLFCPTRVTSALVSRLPLLSRPAPVLAAVPGAQQAQTLVTGLPLQREIAGGDTHVYAWTMVRGQYVRLIVAQQSIDVRLQLVAPDGRPLPEVNNEDGAQRQEQVSQVAEGPGEWRLEVRAVAGDAAAGIYEIRIEELRDANPQDQARVNAETAFARGRVLYRQGTAESLHQSIASFEDVLLLYRRAGDRQGEANTLHLIGLVSRMLGENQQALIYYEQALPLRRAVGDRYGEAMTTHNIGAVYWNLGDAPKALEYYQLALPLRRAVADRRGEAVTLNNLGVAYRDVGDNQKALDYLAQAVPLYRVVRDRSGEAETLGNIGGVYFILGEKQKALEYLDQALALKRAVKDRRGEGSTLDRLAVVYSDFGDQQRALDLVNQGLVLVRAAGDRREEANSLSILGQIYFIQGDGIRALENYNQALLLVRAQGSRLREAAILGRMGAVYDSLGRSQQAQEVYQQAVALAHALGDDWEEAHALAGWARLSSRQGELNLSRSQIEAALRLSEVMRTRVASSELRASYMAERQKDFEFYIELLMRSRALRPADENARAALLVSEQARARSLVESLTEARLNIRQGVNVALLERERSAQLQLNAKAESLTRLLSSNHTDLQASSARKELEAVLANYQQLETELRSSSPRYAALTQPEPLDLKTIQTELLDADTLLLEYSLGTQKSFLWLVTPTSVLSFVLPGRVAIEAAARRLYELLTTRNRQRQDEMPVQRARRLREADAEFTALAASLSEMLLGPARSELGTRRLLIASEGVLQYLPFSLLPTPGPNQRGAVAGGAGGEQSAEKYHPLILDHEIVSLPSASVLLALRRNARENINAAPSVAVFADPVFRADDSRVRRHPNEAGRKVPPNNEAGFENVSPAAVDRSAQESGLLDFRRLVHSREEADAILQLNGKNTNLRAIDFVSSRRTALDSDLSHYRVLHFASHGLLNSQHPELSGIVLSLVNDEGKPIDGFLRLHEIYNLKLNADLVVLSACSTALGKEIRGEGLVGLTRGFMYAGAHSVVASLWSVDDEATAELMKRFYTGMLKDGRRPAGALRAAQVSMLREKRWQSPPLWAAFVLQGEWR